MKAAASGPTSARRRHQGGTLNIDFATYNPLSLVIKDQGWLEEALGDGRHRQLGAVRRVQQGQRGAARRRHRRRLHRRIRRAARALQRLAHQDDRHLLAARVVGHRGRRRTPTSPTSPTSRASTVAATKGTDPYFFLLQSLEEAGVPLDEVDVQNLQHADGRAALENGSVEAWAGLDPLMAASEATAGSTLIYRTWTSTPTASSTRRSRSSRRAPTSRRSWSTPTRRHAPGQENPEETAAILAEVAGHRPRGRHQGHHRAHHARRRPRPGRGAVARCCARSSARSSSPTGTSPSRPTIDKALDELFEPSFAENADPPDPRSLPCAPDGERPPAPWSADVRGHHRRRDDDRRRRGRAFPGAGTANPIADRDAGPRVPATVRRRRSPPVVDPPRAGPSRHTRRGRAPAPPPAARAVAVGRPARASSRRTSSQPPPRCGTPRSTWPSAACWARTSRSRRSACSSASPSAALARPAARCRGRAVATSATPCFAPTLGAIRAVPSLAWVPLLILWMKIGEDSKITLIAIGAFFPASTPPSRRRCGTSTGTSSRSAARTACAASGCSAPAQLPAGAAVGRLRPAAGARAVVAVPRRRRADRVVDGPGLPAHRTPGNNGRVDRIILAIILLAILGKTTDSVRAVRKARHPPLDLTASPTRTGRVLTRSRRMLRG